MAKELSQTAPCGVTVYAPTSFELGQAYSQHQGGCSECQEILEDLRKKIYGDEA